MRSRHSLRRIPDFVQANRHQTLLQNDGLFTRNPLISGDFRVQFAANKKWAMSPLLSPPAGAHTE
jgi:hypothetical protein